MSYVANTFVSRYQGLAKPTGQIGLTQTIFTPGYTGRNAIVWDKEVRGGVHRVEYRGLLLRDDIYDGIFQERRVVGMLCFVEKNDDESTNGNYYKLARNNGLALSDWEIIGSGASINVTKIGGTPTLTTLYALAAPANGDFYNVSDARTSAEVTANLTPYSRSFIYSSDAATANNNAPALSWLPVYGISDPNAHTKGYDTSLWSPAHQAFVQANALFDHLQDANIHREINDSSLIGSATELFSSLRIMQLLDNKISMPDISTVPNPEEMFLAMDGVYRPVSTTGGYTGLLDMGGA